MVVEVWIAIAAIAIFLYVAVDGCQMGAAVLMLTERDRSRRLRLGNLVGTASDANESWFVLVAALLLAGVPRAYDVLLPLLCLPVLLMGATVVTRRTALLALRGRNHPDRWALVLAWSCAAHAFAQGMAVTSILTKIEVDVPDDGGVGLLDFLTGYSVLGGVATIAVYAVAGQILIIVTRGPEGIAQFGTAGALVMPLAAGLVALWAARLPVTSSCLPPGWNGRMTFVFIAVLLGCTFMCWRPEHRRAWLAAAATVVAEVVTLGVIVSLYLARTLPGAAHEHGGAPTRTAYFLLIAFAPLMPIVMILNGYSLWNFQRRVARSRSHVIEAASVRPAPVIDLTPVMAPMPSIESRPVLATT